MWIRVGRGGGERSRFLRPGDRSCFSLILALSFDKGNTDFFLSPVGDLSLIFSRSASRRSLSGLLFGEIVFFLGLERPLLLLLLLDELDDEDERDELPELLDDDREDDLEELLDELPLLSLLLEPESPFFFLLSLGFFFSFSAAGKGDLFLAIFNLLCFYLRFMNVKP